MDIGAIFLLLAVCLLTGLFVARPFMGRRRSLSVSANDQALSTLLAERDRLITALQELDFDYTLGKIPAADYPLMRAELLQHASDVLRQLDAAQPENASVVSAESRVEAVIASRRADAAVEKMPERAVLDDEALEDMLAARRAVHKEKSSGFCQNCGKPVFLSDRFCPHCGKSIR